MTSQEGRLGNGTQRFQTNNCQILCPFPGAALSTVETAGLLTYPKQIAPSRPWGQWQDAIAICLEALISSQCGELQQRVLSRLCTSFPFVLRRAVTEQPFLLQS